MSVATAVAPVSDAVPTADGQQAPRRSQHVPVDLTQSDGDTWQERITVCESVTTAGNPKLLLRSYYRNKRTGERVWDEPPSGASRIDHATADMRKRAESQLQEMQVTLEMIPDDFEKEQEEEDKAKAQKKKKGGIFGRFRNGKSGRKNNKEIHESKDLQLQRAIAMSMAMQSDSDPACLDNTEGNGESEEEQLQMAKALSMSESMANQNMSEEEMIQRALEASRMEAQETAPVASYASAARSMYTPTPSLKSPPPGPEDESDDLDKKMPATKSFDPYAPGSS